RSANAEPGSTLAIAAARVLVEAGDPGATAAFSLLLRDPGARPAALRLALGAGREELGDSLSRVEPAEDEVELWLAALGRSGGEPALARLERNLARPERAWAAAYALARSQESDATDILERALEAPATRRDAARAAALRTLTGGGTPGGFDAALRALEASKLPADRAAASFARAATDSERGAALLAARDATNVCSAARAASFGALALAAATRLARERDPLLRVCLTSSLADTRAADRVPDRTLIELVESDGAATHLAAYALSARDRAELRPRLRELLSSSDPGLRAHVALGLARSADASAVGLLADAYRFETEPRVRRALVLALAARREKGRRATLRLAADLDPDPEARARARRALGAVAEAARTRSETAWLRLDPPDAASPPIFVLIETSEGLALPALPDPDGSVLLTSLTAGEIIVTLSAEPQRLQPGTPP
ncbi:MAG TPA: HEAT repeat domain-containing protein, partial [Polyangiaceae bacterium]